MARNAHRRGTGHRCGQILFQIGELLLKGSTAFGRAVKRDFQLFHLCTLLAAICMGLCQHAVLGIVVASQEIRSRASVRRFDL